MLNVSNSSSLSVIICFVPGPPTESSHPGPWTPATVFTGQLFYAPFWINAWPPGASGRPEGVTTGVSGAPAGGLREPPGEVAGASCWHGYGALGSAGGAAHTRPCDHALLPTQTSTHRQIIGSHVYSWYRQRKHECVLLKIRFYYNIHV